MDKHKTLIFLDDERNPVLDNHYDNVIVVRNFIDFVRIVDSIQINGNINSSLITFSFDHDLCDWHELSKLDNLSD